MSNVTPIKPSKTKRKNRNKAKANGKTLCGNGFHKWQVDKAKVFDVKQGRLVTRLSCARCNQTKVELH